MNYDDCNSLLSIAWDDDEWDEWDDCPDCNSPNGCECWRDDMDLEDQLGHLLG
jgi:hypothetical protein